MLLTTAPLIICTSMCCFLWSITKVWILYVVCNFYQKILNIASHNFWLSKKSKGRLYRLCFVTGICSSRKKTYPRIFLLCKFFKWTIEIFTYWSRERGSLSSLSSSSKLLVYFQGQSKPSRKNIVGNENLD